MPSRKPKLEYKSSKEKLEIVLDIVKKLKNYETNVGKQDIYLDHYSYVKTLSKVFNDYVRINSRQKGKVLFEEINKYIEYDLPINKNGQPLFVIRANDS